ncbi:hypothetical protein [Paraburkholderia sp. BL6669N2]|uniref:hypothetical protein n=1 Tax=Paraburkholderia sp. BL6669N2 TaxID=1938807 RepID=UPI0015F297DF
MTRVDYLRGKRTRRVARAASTPRGEAAAHRLQLGHHLEHLDQPVQADLRDHGAMSRPHLHHAGRGQLEQRFAHGPR